MPQATEPPPVLPLHLSINQVQEMYRQGRASEAAVAEYLRAWNAGPHFTQAVFCDGAIRNFDPELSRGYVHLYEKFGVRT